MLAQGGRLVTERRMVADLYEFDLTTFVWARVPPHPDDAVPGARYFHSTDACESAVLLYCCFFRFFAIIPPPLRDSSPPRPYGALTDDPRLAAWEREERLKYGRGEEVGEMARER